MVPLCFSTVWRHGRHGRFQSQLRRTFFDVVRNILSGDDYRNPKKILERKYIYFTLLAIKYRELRLLNDTNSPDLTCNHRDLPADLYEQAVAELEGQELDRMRNTELRRILQNELHPQVRLLFKTFHQVDQQLGLDELGNDDDDRWFQSVDWARVRSILKNDLDHSKSVTVDESSPQAAFQHGFLQQKQSAIESLLNDRARPNIGSQNSATVDDFGVDLLGKSDQSLRMIRRYQMLNVARSALIRERLGYSVLVLKSLIPNGGRGVFVDGKSLTGSVVALQPGDVWPKEQLLTSSIEVMEHFANDDDCHVSLRFDDYVLDSRLSPVTVLCREGSMNPWAIGHMINHPPVGTLPNCQSTMLDYTERMQLNELMQYIPNFYARDPGWQSRYFDLEPTLVHGLCLVARRDVENEELCYDYRLQSNETPEWYSIVKYGDSMDDEEQVVFFRDEWMKDNK